MTATTTAAAAKTNFIVSFANRPFFYFIFTRPINVFVPFF